MTPASTHVSNAGEAPASRSHLFVQRSCACGSGTSSLSGECDDCRRAKRLGVQAKLTVTAPGDAYEQEADALADRVMGTGESDAIGRAPVQVQRLGGEAAAPGEAAPAIVHDALATPGQPLPDAARAFFETRFGHDFSRTRVHADDTAARSAAAINAAAYTVGNDVVFASGRYAPDSATGRRLLAHELTHVVQQRRGAALGPTVQRSACGHDGQPTRCGASAGVLKLVDAAGDVGQLISVDQWIVEDGLKRHFGPNWAGQVLTPPNPVKQGQWRGQADAIKVTQGAALDLDVVEIKPRSLNGGGCVKATGEARGYVNVLQLIAPRLTALSAGLASVGGVRVDPSRARRPDPISRVKLQKAGVDFSDPTSVQAWTVLNSLQDRLNTVFTTAFTNVNVRPSADGTPDTSYPVAPPIPISCRPKKGKARLGVRHLEFQVNQKGGVSYGCHDECGDADEVEKRKTVVADKTKDEGKKVAPQMRPEMRLDDADRPDTEEDDPVDLPGGGVPWTEVLEVSGAALATVTALHQASKFLKGRELKLAQDAAAKALAEARVKGAIDLARKLNSAKVSRLGTQAYEQELKATAGSLEKLAARDAGFLAKHGVKGARFLGRTVAVLGIVMLARDAYALTVHVSKGGTVDVGLGGMDAELEGGTKIESKGGETGKQDVSGQVKLTNTVVDITTTGIPQVSGQIDLEAENVSVRGPVAGGSASVNLRARLKNTTVVIHHDAVIDGNTLVLQGASEISDSSIEIALPPEAKLDQGRDPGATVTLKGAKLRITERGGGAPSQPGPATGTAAAPAAGASASPGPAKEAGRNAPAPPTSAGAPGQPPKTPGLSTLLRDVQSNDALRRLYTALLGKDGALVTEEAVRRLVALGGKLSRHPEVVDAIIKGLTPAPVTDPIAQVVVPIEERLRLADEQIAKEREKQIADARQKSSPKKGGPSAGPTTPGEERKTDTTAGPKDPSAAAGPAVDPQDVRELQMATLMEALEFPAIAGGAAPPAATVYPMVWRVRVGKSELVYQIPVQAKFLRALPAGRGQVWRALYQFVPPAGVLLSEQGDMPIRFTDTGALTIELFALSGK